MTGTWTSTSLPYLRAVAPGSADAWTQESAGRGTQRLVEVTRVYPPAAVREALRLTPEEQAVVRRRIMLFDDTPVELTDSYYPEQIARGTALAEPAKIKGGAPTLLSALGHQVRRVVEDVTARGATPSEAAQLDMPTGSPVLELFRASLSETGDPIEASVMVMKGPRSIRYETKVD